MNSELESGVALIAAERNRQIAVEGWTPEHDDTHDCGELVSAAEAYLEASDENASFWDQKRVPVWWPATWSDDWFKADRKDPIRSLTKAGALIAAEIDRLLRERARNACE